MTGKFVLMLALIAWPVSSNAQLRTYKVLPSATDADIDSYTKEGDEHYIYLNDSLKPVNKLFVFLPGTLGRGKNPRFIVPYAASLGYHAIALTYSSDIALAQICKESDDKECFEKGRQEIAFGHDLSSQLQVNIANGINNRLHKLLIHLTKNYPQDNWKQFLTKDNEINWKKVCLAGQSQGGGHAAYIAQIKEVDRVIMFASPKDYSNFFKRPANWLYRKSKTTIDHYYGFVHSLDGSNGCTWKEQQEIFTVMGIDHFGEWENVDAQIPPYNNTHMLTSNKAQRFPHGSVISDESYKPVWKYLLTVGLK